MIACLNQHRFQVWTDNVYYPLWPLYIWHVTCELHVFYQHCSRSYLYAASYGQVIWAYVILPADMSACSTCRGVRCERVSRSAGTAHTHTHVCAQGSMHIPRVCRSARTCAGVCAKIDRRMRRSETSIWINANKGRELFQDFILRIKWSRGIYLMIHPWKWETSGPNLLYYTHAISQEWHHRRMIYACNVTSVILWYLQDLGLSTLVSTSPEV